MELGIALPHFGPHASPQAMVQVAQEAERLGLSAVWALERLLRPTFPIPQPRGGAAPMAKVYGNSFEALSTLTYVAAKTERIKLGTSVLDTLFHVPVVLAKRFAALDQFSNGRAIAGLGQGANAPEFEAANLSFKRRGAGFEDYLAALRAAWGPDPVSYKGRFYSIPESEISPKPVQPGGPKIIIGGSAPSAIERAARIGDGWNPSLYVWEQFEANLKIFREAAHKAGRDDKDLQVVARVNARPDQPNPQMPGPLTGDWSKIADDFARLKSLDIRHAFYDMNFAETPIEDQLRLLQPLLKALG